MLDTLIAHFQTPGYQIILAASILAGLVRGFSGFGTGMILIPVIAAVYSPQVAVALVFVIDATAALPLVIQQAANVKWRTMIPFAIGFLATIPLGIYLLAHSDPSLLRWVLAIVILVAVALLWSGWTWKGPQNNLVSACVGGISGVAGGACGLPGPPAIVYWMASNLPAAIVRANTMVFLYIGDLAIGAGLIWSGILTMDTVIKGLGAFWFYLAGLAAGAIWFRGASEEFYRRIAFLIILTAAITSLPILDGIFSR